MKIIVIIILTVWFGFLAYVGYKQNVIEITPTPVPNELPGFTSRPSPTLTPSSNASPKKSAIPSPTPKPVGQLPTPTPSVMVAPTVLPTPTPVIIYVTPTPTPIPTSTPTPTPTPVPVQSAVINDVSFQAKVTAVSGEEYAVVRVDTSSTAKLSLNYILDDGSIMEAYNNGSKDIQRLNTVLIDYVAEHGYETIIASGQTFYVFRAPQFPEGHIWFALTAENNAGQKVQYLKNGYYWDWNNNFTLTIQ